VLPLLPLIAKARSGEAQPAYPKHHFFKSITRKGRPCLVYFFCVPEIRRHQTLAEAMDLIGIDFFNSSFLTVGDAWMGSSSGSSRIESLGHGGWMGSSRVASGWRAQAMLDGREEDGDMAAMAGCASEKGGRRMGTRRCTLGEEREAGGDKRRWLLVPVRL
jgi:hypothetical protein